MSDPAAKPAAPAKSGFNWGLPLFLIFMCLAVALGAEFLYNQKRDIEWVLSMIFRYIPIVIVVIIVMTVIKNANNKGDH